MMRTNLLGLLAAGMLMAGGAQAGQIRWDYGGLSGAYPRFCGRGIS